MVSPFYFLNNREEKRHGGGAARGVCEWFQELAPKRPPNICRITGRPDRGTGWRRQHHVADLSSESRQSRSEEHTSELQSLMRISYAVFCLKKKKQKKS